MQDLHIKRFAAPSKIHGQVEPEDRSWQLIVTDAGPHLMVRVNLEDETGNTTHGYIDVRDLAPNETVAQVQSCTLMVAHEIDPDAVISLHGEMVRVRDLGAVEA